MREAERREKAALDYAQGTKREMEIIQDKFSTTEEKYDKAFSDKVSEQLKSAQEELAQSIETGDAAKQVLANKKIAALSIEEARLSAAEKYRSDLKPKTPEEQDYLRHRETPSRLPRQQAARGTPDPQAEAWAEKNEWFGKDRAMTFTAFEIHKDLVEKEGFDPKSDEYYEEINKRIKPHLKKTCDSWKCDETYVKIMKSIPHCQTIEDYEALLPWNVDIEKVNSQ